MFGDKKEGVRRRKNGVKKLVVVGIEKKRMGVSRLYARQISNADPVSPGGFRKDHIAATAKMTTDQWTAFGARWRRPSTTWCGYPPEGMGSIPEPHRAVMNLKGWLRGMDHHVDDLQDYLNEYLYRSDRSFMKEGIFDNLMARMMNAPPRYIKNINA